MIGCTIATPEVPDFLDINILVYAISTDPGEAAKRGRAVALLEQDDNALSVQVLQEFYVQATRPRPGPTLCGIGWR